MTFSASTTPPSPYHRSHGACREPSRRPWIAPRPGPVRHIDLLDPPAGLRGAQQHSSEKPKARSVCAPAPPPVPRAGPRPPPASRLAFLEIWESTAGLCDRRGGEPTTPPGEQLAAFSPNRVLTSGMRAPRGPQTTEIACARHPPDVDTEVHPWSTPASRTCPLMQITGMASLRPTKVPAQCASTRSQL
jgi:hypothetical protein